MRLHNTKTSDLTLGLQIEPNLAETLLNALKETENKLSIENKNAIFVTSPLLRRDLSKLFRQQSEDLIVMSFSELPDNRQIEIVSVIGRNNNDDNSNVQ